MAGEACEHCGAFALDLDAQTGVCACEACGRVVECEDLQHQTHGFQDGVWERAPGQLVTDQQAGGAFGNLLLCGLGMEVWNHLLSMQ